MKRILIGITIIGVGGLLAYNVVQGNRTEVYVNEVTDTVEAVEVESTIPEHVQLASEEAKKAVLRAYELEQDRIHIVEEMDAKKAEYDLYVKEQETKLEEIERQLSF